MSDSDARRDDEIVSAYLDGEATAEERARVENDPRLQARLAELRHVATAVGTPHFFADSPGRDELIARAIAATPPAEVPSSERRSPSGAPATVVDLDAARRHRRRLTILSAAAAVLLLILAVPILNRDDEATTTDLAGPAIDAASTEDETDTDVGDGAPDPETGIVDDTVVDAVPTIPPQTTTVVGVEPPMSTIDTVELAVVELGSFTSRAEAQVAVTEAIDAALVTAAAEAVDEPDAPARSVDVGAECDAGIRLTDDEVRTLVYAASFDLPDGEHLVLVYDLEATGAVNGAIRIYEVLLPACTPVGDETI